MTRNYKVIFQPAGRRGEIEEGRTILQAAQSLGVDIEALCGNKKVCGKCKVRIEEGYFEKDNIDSGMAHIFPAEPSADELKHIKPQDGPGIRLACQCEIRVTSRSLFQNAHGPESRSCARRPRSSRSRSTLR